MAKRIVSLSYTTTPGRSADIRLLPGEQITGRWFNSLLTGSVAFWIDILDKGQMILKSSAAPTSAITPYTRKNVVIGQFLDFGVVSQDTALEFDAPRDKSDIERILSVYILSATGADTLNIEIDSPG